MNISFIVYNKRCEYICSGVTHVIMNSLVKFQPRYYEHATGVHCTNNYNPHIFKHFLKSIWLIISMIWYVWSLSVSELFIDQRSDSKIFVHLNEWDPKSRVRKNIQTSHHYYCSHSGGWRPERPGDEESSSLSSTILQYYWFEPPPALYNLSISSRFHRITEWCFFPCFFIFDFTKK